MADRYFKKSKNKFKVGYSDKVFKYNKGSHKIEDIENRFEECDVKGNLIKKIVKKSSKKKAGK